MHLVMLRLNDAIHLILVVMVIKTSKRDHEPIKPLLVYFNNR